MKTVQKLRSLCVFCGSSFGASPSYVEAARATGRLIAERGLTLVFGGGNVGLMGELSRSALAAGAPVLGVIPEAIHKMVPHVELTELYVVATMHERKNRMHELSDGFVALPGGIGTFEEIFEAYTWSQLGFHEKPVGLLNIAGFYDGLIDFLAHTESEGFLKKAHRESLIVEADPAALIDRFAAYEPKYVSKLDK
jgi:uncharacterized protein (TIGR00730 family)